MTHLVRLTMSHDNMNKERANIRMKDMEAAFYNYQYMKAYN